MSTTFVDDFEGALIGAGYAPSTARSARPAAIDGATGHGWSQRLFAQWQAGDLKPLRGERPRLAVRLIGAGIGAEQAHKLARKYLLWAEKGELDATRDDEIRHLQKVLARQPDPFLGPDPREFSLRMEGLDLTVRQTAEFLGVSRPAIRNWLAGKPIAPSWACELLAEKATETGPPEASKSKQDEE